MKSTQILQTSLKTKKNDLAGKVFIELCYQKNGFSAVIAEKTYFPLELGQDSLKDGWERQRLKEDQEILFFSLKGRIIECILPSSKEDIHQYQLEKNPVQLVHENKRKEGFTLSKFYIPRLDAAPASKQI